MSIFTQTKDLQALNLEITAKFTAAIEEDDCHTIFEILIPAVLKLDRLTLIRTYPPLSIKCSESGIWVIAILAQGKISESFPWHPEERPDQLSLYDEILKRLDLAVFKQFNNKK
jgi:hypothetical protein